MDLPLLPIKDMHNEFSRLENFIGSGPYQFGFKKEHGTELCIFALKETINYYRKLNSSIFLCFLDVKSAFDTVSYNRLLNVFLDRGVPK